MRKFNSVEEAVEYLQLLPINVLITTAAEAIISAQQNQGPKKITISEDQFREHFKIAGFTETGEKEKRGRKKKD